MGRAKNLSNDDIVKIIGILDGWSGRLTWGKLLDAVERHLFARYTRQALHRHPRIQQAFDHRKLKLMISGGRPQKVVASPELQVAIDRVARLKAENERLEAENSRLLEQFARWAYNASTRGLDETFLNSHLPKTSRRRGR